MNKTTRTLSVVLSILAVLFVAVLVQARVYLTTPLEEPDEISQWDATGLFYACTRGNYEPACDAINANPRTQTTGYDVEQGALLHFYACNRGNIQLACDAINIQSAEVTSPRYDFMAMHYACIRGDYAPACEYIGRTPLS